jgi:hypothetical protein
LPSRVDAGRDISWIPIIMYLVFSRWMRRPVSERKIKYPGINIPGLNY